MTIDEFLTNVRRILHCSSGGVKADTSVSRWQFHGMLTMFAGRIGLMQIGDSGDAVKGLQSALMAAGFPLPLHGADGNFGAETEQALRQFQQKSGLDASGAADAETLAALRLLNG
jgi:murein L,D-transpeptidase YcbB/YkuD